MLGYDAAKTKMLVGQWRLDLEYEVFRTAQKSLQVYESAALTAELRAPRTHKILHEKNLMDICSFA